MLNYKKLVTAPLAEFSLMLSNFMTARIGMFSLAWRTGRVLALAFYVRRQYKNAEAKTKALEEAGKPQEASDDVWDDVHKRMAALICRHMLEFQGLWIKVGQFLSTRADIMPDAWIEELRVLQVDRRRHAFARGVRPARRLAPPNCPARHRHSGARPRSSQTGFALSPLEQAFVDSIVDMTHDHGKRSSRSAAPHTPRHPSRCRPSIHRPPPSTSARRSLLLGLRVLHLHWLRQQGC